MRTVNLQPWAPSSTRMSPIPVRKRSQTQHVELILAFRDRDADWARSTMRSHVLAARHILLRNNAEADAAKLNGATHSV